MKHERKNVHPISHSTTTIFTRPCRYVFKCLCPWVFLCLSVSFLQATQEQQGFLEALGGVAEDVKLAEMLQVCAACDLAYYC